MDEPQLTPNGARQALFLSRNLSGPDGSPLYAYRFEAGEYDGVRKLLSAGGVNALRDPSGSALLVMYLAEWFRRERDGGGWNWVTPLGHVGIRYHPTEAWADVRYPEVRDRVEAGLRAWRRPVPPRRSLLTTIVQESGFPAADVAKGRLGAWLRRAILTAERGLNSFDAVAAEAWRAPETLAQALFTSVVTLCEAIVGLRRLVANVQGDALAALDRMHPNWRATLPFDVGDDDFRRLVEQLVVVRQVEEPALRVERRYVLVDGRWAGQAEVWLGGKVDERCAPRELLAGLAGYSRARLYPRGEASRWTSPIATLESESDADGIDRWCIRPLVARHRPMLGHDQEIRMAVEAGAGPVAEFIPFGGEPLVGPVIALRPDDTDDPREASSLEVVGEASISVSRPWLVLALTEDAASRASVEGEHYFLAAATLDGRRLMAFSGVVRLAIEGETLVWKTGAAIESSERLVLIGARIPRLRESVFDGPPDVWLERDGQTSSVRRADICWKPVGRGSWRNVADAPPLGSVYLAVRRTGRISAMSRTMVAPPGLRVHPERAGRRLRIHGLGGAAVCASSGSSPLAVACTAGEAIVELGRLPPGTGIGLTLSWRSPSWESSLDVSIDDPFAEPMLLTAEGGEAPPHAALTLSRLKGYRLLSHGAAEIMFQGRAPNAPPVHTFRTSSGPMPLAAFEQVIEELLGAFESLDATVRLSWANRGDWFAEVGRWEVRQPPQPVRSDSVFAALATRTAPRRRAISISAPSAGCALDLRDVDPIELGRRLDRDLAPGPWLLTGTASDGAVLRPFVLTDPSLMRGAERVPTAIGSARLAERSILDPTKPSSLAGEEPRWLVELCMGAKTIDAPYAAIEALRALAGTPRLLPPMLAACLTPEERYAVLDLQASLPSMWCTTEIRAWRSAFAAAHVVLGDQLAAAGLPDARAMAGSVILRALGQIAEAMPVLSLHARLCIQILGGSGAHADMPYALTRPWPRDDLATIAQRLVTRRSDDRLAVLPRLSDLAGEHAALCRKFGDAERFAEVLAAPLVAARLAAGRLAPHPATVAACRTAWTWDREYFEDAFRAALLAEAQNPVPEEVG